MSEKAHIIGYKLYLINLTNKNSQRTLIGDLQIIKDKEKILKAKEKRQITTC